MTIPRYLVVDPARSGIYHCVSRCVRRAFLCGDGFDHRRDWIESRLHDLAGIFAIDVCGFAVMSNHFHVVLRTNPDLAQSWGAEEIARRWTRLFPPRRDPSVAEEMVVEDAVRRLSADVGRIALLRRRLSDLSWFMRCLKQRIARLANQEDDCTGRFWEGRFKCHRLLDGAAVLACLVYVDLNAIRAGAAETPEQSDHTSVQDRIRVRRYLRRRRRRAVGRTSRRTSVLLPSLASEELPRHEEDGIWLARIDRRRDRGRRGRGSGLLSLSLDQYLQIVDASGRAIRAGKRGAIPERLMPILQRLELDESTWLASVGSVGRMVGTAIGNARSLVEEAVRRQRQWVVGAMPI